MSRTGKNDPRLKAYADVDEANCTIGVVLATCAVRADIADVPVQVAQALAQKVYILHLP